LRVEITPHTHLFLVFFGVDFCHLSFRGRNFVQLVSCIGWFSTSVTTVEIRPLLPKATFLTRFVERSRNVSYWPLDCANAAEGTTEVRDMPTRRSTPPRSSPHEGRENLAPRR
jgi:hypothetical protein